MSRSMLFEIADELLLPPGVTGLPPQILAANEAAHRALDRHREADRAVAAAHQAAAAAERLDHAAAEAAAIAGGPMPAATAPGKRAAVVEANRAIEATDTAAKVAIRALFDVVEAHQPAYVEWARVQAETAAAPLRTAVEKILADYIAARDALALHENAQTWHNNPKSALLSSGLGQGHRVRSRFARELERRRGAHGLSRYSVETQILPMLAALAIKLDEELADTGSDNPGPEASPPPPAARARRSKAAW